MTEKQGGEEFDDDDEEAARTLATWAGIAIENARLYTSLSEREAEVEQALRRAETSVDIARAVGGETDVDRVLDLIVKRARALVEARTLLVLLRRGGQPRRRCAGRGGRRARWSDLTIPTEDAVFQAAMQERVAQHLERGVAALGGAACASGSAPKPPWWSRCSSAATRSGRSSRSTAKPGGTDFDEEDLRLLQAFATSAATAVATAQSGRVRAPAAAGRDRRARAPALGPGAARRRPAGPGRDPHLPRDRASGRRGGSSASGSRGPPRRRSSASRTRSTS